MEQKKNVLNLTLKNKQNVFMLEPRYHHAKVLKNLKVSYLHVFSYSERENTYATKLENKVKIDEIKARRKKMQDRLYQVMAAKYQSEIDDAKFKISTLVDRPILIPEHIDITGEVDKLLQKISSAEDRMAAMRRHYGKKEAD